MDLVFYVCLVMLSFALVLRNGNALLRSRPKLVWRNNGYATSRLLLKASDEKILVIVESPAKAKTIQKIVGEKSNNYVIDFCAGHIRDLCNNAAQLPKEYEQKLVYPGLGLKTGELGVDVHNNFEPIFVNSPQKRDIIKRLKDASNTATRILLATDEDREGEAISWHLVDILKPKVPYQRAVFHEITKTAIEKAFEEPRDIDMNLVQAQQTRSILDKLTGYTLSPLLWKFVAYGLSAGRVQTCGLHIITEREQERWAFKSSQFYSITAFFTPPSQTHTSIEAKLVEYNGQKVADEKDFDGSSGEAKTKKLLVLHQESALQVLQTLSHPACQFHISDISERLLTRNPSPPYITSTLQQDASRKLGFSPARTMSLAQGLYEGGYITYMRTDSVTLSKMAQEVRAKMILEVYGKDFLAPATTAASTNSSSGSVSSNKKSKKKTETIDFKIDESTTLTTANSTSTEIEKEKGTPLNAQEAHEAIRPAEKDGSFQLTSSLPSTLDSDALRLYDMILKRTLASGMKASKSKTLTLTIAAESQHNGDSKAIFRTSETIVTFPGFLRCFADKPEEKSEFVKFATVGLPLTLNKDVISTTASKAAAVTNADPDTDNDSESVTEAEADSETDNSESLSLNEAFPGLKSSGHITRPPSRYTEASFVKELESLGVGRPSTYSSILSILKDRGYVIVDKQTLVPTGRGMIVSKFMSEHFPQFVDETFTAQMEEALDHIAHGKLDKNQFLHDFYLKGYGKASSSSSKQEKGLLAKIDDKLAHELHSQTSETRRLRIPYLQQFGELSMYKAQLFFDFYQDPTNTAASINGEEQPVIRKKIPSEMEADLRLLTPEFVATLRGNETYIAMDGLDLGRDSNTGYHYRLKAGPFGRYIEVDRNRTRLRYQRISVPNWIDAETLTLTQAIELVSLPREIGLFPDTNTMIRVDLLQNKLRLTADNFPYQVDLDGHIFPSDITLTDSIKLLQAATVPNSSIKKLVGHWKDEEIVIRSGRFGPYFQCGKVIAGLGNKLDPENVTEEQAIERLEMKIRREARTGNGKTKVKAKKTATGGSDDDAEDSAGVQQEKIKTVKATSKRTATASSSSAAVVNEDAKKPRARKAAATESPVVKIKVVSSSSRTKKAATPPSIENDDNEEGDVVKSAKKHKPRPMKRVSVP